MNQEERRIYLIRYLLDENPRYKDIGIPEDISGQKPLLRGLLNIRMPKEISPEFLRIQDDYLRAAIQEKGITEVDGLKPIKPGIYLWKGDITTLRADAIVNAANSYMLGCFQPNHHCIDNAIHTYAGIELRLFCNELMRKQGGIEPVGQAKITPGFNLPCSYILHTVGPIVKGVVRSEHREQLASSYRSCLELAAEKGLASVAFCCISTGVFHFPKEEAANIAIRTVEEFLKRPTSVKKAVFNVFTEEDEEIYARLLGQNQ